LLLRHHQGSSSRRAGRAGHDSSAARHASSRANIQAARATQSLDRRGRGHGRGQGAVSASTGRVIEEASAGTVRGERKESVRGSRSHVNGPKGSGRKFRGSIFTSTGLPKQLCVVPKK
jgi:hypothetical protein